MWHGQLSMLGGQGYLIKSNAHSELFAPVEVVLFGKRFVSRGLADHAI